MKFFIVLILTAGVVVTSGSVLPYANRAHRVIGGVEATPHEIPSILNLGFHTCAATLIHPQWALTAAHCVVFDGELDQLVGGDHIINKAEGTEQKIRVIEKFVHPFYQRPTNLSNDAALLKLEKPFEINEYVQIAQLPPRNFEPIGDALVAGWGVNDTLLPSYELRKVTVPLVSTDECIATLGIFVDDSMICAGTSEKGSSILDNGGPMFCDSPNGKVHCGIVSGFRVLYPPLREGQAKIIYARTSHFLDWIHRITGIQV